MLGDDTPEQADLVFMSQKTCLGFYKLLALYLVLDKLNDYLNVSDFGGLGLFSFLIASFLLRANFS